MTYEIRIQDNDLYYVYDTKRGVTIKTDLDVYEANTVSWQGKDPSKRYQVLANSFANRLELTWYSEENGIVITNGYSTVEGARLEIIDDLLELCLNNDYVYHPNPHGDFSIVDTFTGEEVPYEISDEEVPPPNRSLLESN